MVTYLILKNPGHNRVYYNGSQEVSLSELKIALLKLKVDVLQMSIKAIQGIEYYSFSLSEKLDEKSIQIISNLSFNFALFEEQLVDNEVTLKPIGKINNLGVASKISNVLKYPGKTNEQFTKMMINVAAMVSQFDSSHKLKLLDPISGRGTTLFEGAVLGYDTYGVEIDDKSYHDCIKCYERFLKDEKMKHLVTKQKIYGDKIKKSIMSQKIEYTLTKEAFKKPDKRHTLMVCNGNTIYSDLYYKKEMFHIIVGDLPYGIAHGNTSRDKQKGSLTRNPMMLLEKALPAYYKVLKKGGVLVLAWNKFVFSKEDFITLLEKNGFTIPVETVDCNFEHMVDQSIKRDIVIAKKI